MIFLEKCNELIEEFKQDCKTQKNGTLMLKLGNIPRSGYAFYKGLEQEHIKHFLIDAYKNNMPKEYLELIENFNGIRLFTVKVNYYGKFSFAHPRFAIYGIPMVPPGKREDEEPFDVRIEDLARHRKISDKWLKVGSYTKNIGDETDHDIFVDTEDGKVYTCMKNTCKIDETWNSLDECLCELYDRLSTTEWEYNIK